MLAHADVGGEDRGEAAGGGHCSGSPALRKPSIQPVPIFDIARIGMVVDPPSPRRLPLYHRSFYAGGGQVALERFMGLRFLARQGKRHNEI